MGGAAMLLACLPAVALAASAPSWVTSFPHDPEAYVGIGRADKRQHPERYREAAQAAALSQISREISVSLRAEENLSRREDGRGWEESWDQKVQADSRNELSGYRLVDVHETGTEFWVYYALGKEEHARQVESRWSAMAAPLVALLAARDLPEARRRLAPLDPSPGPASEARARLESLAERIRQAVGTTVLAPEGEPWTWHPGSGNTRVGVRLREGKDGKDWQGSMRLRIHDQAVPAGTCEVRTDGEGRFDLAPLFRDCGLEPGRWRVTWMEPEPEGPSADVEARIRAGEWSLSVLAVEAGLIPWQEPVAAELAALPGPYFRLRREADGGKTPRLEVSLVAAESDSLDGLHFATLRGTWRLPEGGARPVTGKGGHTDPAKARKRAARDFAVQVGKRLAKIGQ